MSTHETVMAEADNPHNLVIVGAVVVAGAFFLAIVIGVIQFFGFAVRDEVNAKVYEPVSTELRELRATEQEKLTRYRWVDKSAGVLRIPLERATELTLRDWKGRPSGVVAAGGAAVVPASEETTEDGAPVEGSEGTTAPAPQPGEGNAQ